MFTIKELFDLAHTKAKEYLSAFTYPWEALPGIKAFIRETGKRLGAEYEEIAPEVWVHRSASIAKTACLESPCIIGAGTQVRTGAFIRGSVLIGENCVVGNSTELKNAILFDGVQVPHYNYVGDSILGYKAHFGAGAITSNVKSDKLPVIVRDGEQEIQTGLKKVGAFVGDFVEIGCNSVLNPGTVIGKESNVYPLSCVRGTVLAKCIYKTKGEIVAKKE
ncbi:MAG: UDP-N-acetylglucosamine pyrophosphorylase [Clostridia bacterium]|nr:UDP-N-acetylglucosamine pyrophosphorylase [Clostridia bacterium]